MKDNLKPRFENIIRVIFIRVVKNELIVHVILYHKSNLVYTVVFPHFLIFQQNNSAQTLVLIFFTSRHYYFVEKLKIVEKQLCKLNCS